jgi:hypothetical protein
MLWGKKPKIAEPAGVVHRPAGTPHVDPVLFQQSALRRRPTLTQHMYTAPVLGMWVVYGNRTGILTGLLMNDTYEIMIVKPDGTNDHSMRALGQELRQAWLEEIPAGRRSSLEEMMHMGYHPRPA